MGRPPGSKNKVKSNTSKIPKKECIKCGKLKPMTSFYMSNNLDLHTDGKYPICTDDVRKTLDVNNKDSVKEILIKLNRPFLIEKWNSSLIESNETGKHVLGVYLKNIKLNNKSLTYKDSIDGEVPLFSQHKQETTKISQENLEVTEEIKEKWGEGYKPEEYRLFEKKWSKLIDNYGEKTSLHTEGLITYIRFRVKEEIATAQGLNKDAKEWGGMADAAAKNAKLNVSQLSKSDISGGVDLLSQLFEAVETEVGIIPLLPRLLEQPYDDADMIIWSIVNYARRLEDKPPVAYRDIWNFYDEMLEEFYKQKNYDKSQIEEYKATRNNVFRDLSEVYKEPLYEGEDDG